MKPIRIVIVDDSAICRVQLASFLSAEGDIEVVGQAEDGSGVLELLKSARADLLIVDFQMPKTNGLETITRVMAHTPLPILVVTGEPLGPERQRAFESIRRGALDLAEKPSLFDTAAQARLRQTVRRLATVPVVRHVSGKLNARPLTVPSPSILPPKGETALVVGIGSSAGGPMALATLLGALEADLPAAVVVVQHLPPTFLSAFGEFLLGRTQLQVEVMTRDNSPLRAGVVYLPGRDAHIGLTGVDSVGNIDTPPKQGHRPSVDVLFETLARFAGPRAAGIVLSGIGRDGTDGLLALRRSGGLCLAQDQNTSAVWGMPRSAIESQAAESALPPRGLADVVTAWARARQKR